MERFQFSLRTLVILTLTLWLVIGIGVYGATHRSFNYRDSMAAKSRLQMIAYALSHYVEKFGTLPADNSQSMSGGAVLYKAFTSSKDEVFEIVVGRRRLDKNGDPALMSNFDGRFEYKLLRNEDNTVRGCIIVDPGRDRLYGGIIDSRRGYLPTSRDKNRDGKFDCKDDLKIQYLIGERP